MLSTNQQMAFLEKFLVIKPSKISGAGKGLFTKIKIPKGTCIVEYKGRLVKWVDVKHDDGHNGYLLRVNRSWAIDARPYKKAMGRFANDAMGMSRNNRLRNNGEYLIEGFKCFIYATKDIAPHSEILVGYGKDYWKLARQIAKIRRK